jgi:hypothetical protein
VLLLLLLLLLGCSRQYIQCCAANAAGTRLLLVQHGPCYNAAYHYSTT